MFQPCLKYEKTITMVTVQCCECGVVFGMPSDLNERFRNDPSAYFYCPSGHQQHYSKSKEKLLRERAEAALKDKENQLQRAIEEKITAEKLLNKTNLKLKRVEKGVCPCCNRTFINLQRHMQAKHPEIKNPNYSPNK